MNNLPANIEIEQIVLGSFLMQPQSLYACSLLDPEDFFASEHQQIFSLIALAAKEGRHVTPIALAPAISDLKFGDITQQEYLLRMMKAADAPTYLQSHIAELKQLSARRKLIGLGGYLAGFGQTPTAPLSDFLTDAVHELDLVLSGIKARRNRTSSIADLAKSRIESLSSGDKPEMIHTGLSDLNRIMGGWHRGELAVIAARPSMGKTACALSSLRQAAQHGTSSIFFSLEITSEQAVNRLLADAVWNSQTPISYDRIDQHRLDDFEISRLQSAAQKISELPMVIDDERGLTVSEIGARARRIRDDFERKGRRLDVVCIDHLGKVKASNRYAGNKVHETGEKTNALAQLALDLDVAVVVLQQLNRGAEGREDKRPGLADLRDSGNIEEDADTVSFIYRPAYYLDRSRFDDPEKEEKRLSLLEKKKNVLEWIVSKNRRGPICNQEFYADLASNCVRDLI